MDPMSPLTPPVSPPPPAKTEYPDDAGDALENNPSAWVAKILGNHSTREDITSFTITPEMENGSLKLEGYSSGKETLLKGRILCKLTLRNGRTEEQFLEFYTGTKMPSPTDPAAMRQANNAVLLKVKAYAQFHISANDPHHKNDKTWQKIDEIRKRGTISASLNTKVNPGHTAVQIKWKGEEITLAESAMYKTAQKTDQLRRLIRDPVQGWTVGPEISASEAAMKNLPVVTEGRAALLKPPQLQGKEHEEYRQLRTKQPISVADIEQTSITPENYAKGLLNEYRENQTLFRELRDELVEVKPGLWGSLKGWVPKKALTDFIQKTQNDLRACQEALKTANGAEKTKLEEQERTLKEEMEKVGAKYLSALPVLEALERSMNVQMQQMRELLSDADFSSPDLTKDVLKKNSKELEESSASLRAVRQSGLGGATATAASPERTLEEVEFLLQEIEQSYPAELQELQQAYKGAAGLIRNVNDNIKNKDPQPDEALEDYNHDKGLITDYQKRLEKHNQRQRQLQALLGQLPADAPAIADKRRGIQDRITPLQARKAPEPELTAAINEIEGYFKEMSRVINRYKQAKPLLEIQTPPEATKIAIDSLKLGIDGIRQASDFIPHQKSINEALGELEKYNLNLKENLSKAKKLKGEVEKGIAELDQGSPKRKLLIRLRARLEKRNATYEQEILENDALKAAYENLKAKYFKPPLPTMDRPPRPPPRRPA